jgi:hypothetical protein
MNETCSSLFVKGHVQRERQKMEKCVQLVLQLSVDLPSTQILAAFLVRYPETESMMIIDPRSIA